MPNLTPTCNAPAMSSRDIAELVGSRHDSVKRAIERLSMQKSEDKPSVISLPPLVGYLDSLGRPASEYLFSGDKGKRDSLVVVAQLCPEFTAAIVDRWQELEAMNRVQLPDFTNPAVAARAWADQVESNQQLQIENQQQSQKIASLENLFHEGMTIPQFCKGLNGVNVMQVCGFLQARNWLFNESKSSTRWRTASYARDKYLTEHQATITPHGAEPFTAFTPVLLRKGAARLYDLYLSNELPMKKTWDGLFTHDKTLRGAA